MTKGKILGTAALLAVLILGFGFMAVHYINKASGSCTEASQLHEQAQKNLEAATSQAKATLIFFKDENSFGFDSTPEGESQIAQVTKLVQNEPVIAEVSCNSDLEARALREDANKLQKHANELDKGVSKLTQDVVAHVAPKISDRYIELSDSVTKSLATAQASLKVANEAEAFGKIDGSLEAIKNAQRLVDAPAQLPSLPGSISSIDDIRSANALLDRLSEIQSEAEHYANALKERVDTYTAEVESTKPTEEQTSQTQSAQEATCADVVLVAKQCTNYAEIQYLASSGWNPSSAHDDAYLEGCSQIVHSPNPCTN